MRSAVRFGFLAFVGMLLMQAAWILAMPPYHGIDEFDHAYRAAGVARDQWVLKEPTPEGRGWSVAVPGDMVDAASNQCDALPYTMPGNCHPVAELDDGLVVVATAAAPYNPLYYFLVGTAAEPFDGIAAIYVMRSVSALMCAFGAAVAAFCLGLMRAGPWTRLGFTAGLTPVLVYSASLPAPNSVEIVAALIVWAALLATASEHTEPAWARRCAWLAGLAAAVVVVPRALGPFWLALIGLVLAVFLGRSRLGHVLRVQRPPVVTGLVLVVVAVGLSATWSAYAGMFSRSPDVTEVADKSDVIAALQPTVWTLQLIGAFPFRGNAAPLPIYVLVLMVVVPMIAVALRRGSARQRVAIAGSVVLTLTVPVALTLASSDLHGVVWQGRYQLPFVVGILMLCGTVLDRPGRPHRLAPDVVGVAVVLLALAQAWSVVFVARFEGARTDVPAHNPDWVTLPPLMLGVLAGLGGLLLGASAVHEMRMKRIVTPATGGVTSAPSEKGVTG